MKRLAAIAGACLLLAAATAWAGKEPPAWIEGLARRTPGPFPAIEPGIASYRFGWSGVAAAEGRLRFSRPRPGLARMDLDARTIGTVRALWRLDAEAFSVCDAALLSPVRVRQAEEYRSRTVLTAQEFEPGAALRTRGSVGRRAAPPGFFEDRPAGKETMRAWTGEKPRRVKIPGLLDIHSAFLYLRSQPLAQGDRYRMIVLQGTDPYLATVRVTGREKLTLPAGVYPAIRLDLLLRHIGKDFTLKPHRAFKRATGWISDDARRLPLKLEAEIFVGSVWAELASFTPASESKRN